MVKIITSVVDDDNIYLLTIKKFLLDRGVVGIKFFQNAKDFMKDFIDDEDVRLVILDYIIGTDRGLDVLKEINKNKRYCKVIVMSAQSLYTPEGSTSIIVDLFHNGLFRYVDKSESDWLCKLDSYYKEAVDDIKSRDQLMNTIINMQNYDKGVPRPT